MGSEDRAGAGPIPLPSTHTVLPATSYPGEGGQGGAWGQRTGAWASTRVCICMSGGAREEGGILNIPVHIFELDIFLSVIEFMVHVNF